jgi:hypothetical protein
MAEVEEKPRGGGAGAHKPYRIDAARPRKTRLLKRLATVVFGAFSFN